MNKSVYTSQNSNTLLYKLYTPVNIPIQTDTANDFVAYIYKNMAILQYMKIPFPLAYVSSRLEVTNSMKTCYMTQI